MWIGSKPGQLGYTFNNTFRNCSSQEYVAFIQTVAAFMENDYFENISGSDRYIVNLNWVVGASVKNITFNNVSGEHLAIDSIMIIDPIFPSVVIDGFTVIDCKTGSNSFLRIYKTLSGSFTIKNILFDNVMTAGGYPLITGGTVTGETMQNLTFQNIYKQDPDQNTNIIIDFDAFSLAQSGEFNIDSVVITNSTVPFWNLGRLLNNETNGASLTMSNIDYHDCTFEFGEELLSFKNMYSTSDFKMTITDSKFYNLNFVRGGDLLYLKHQVDTQLEIKNSHFYNLTGATILVESFNKQFSSMKTKVLLNNITVYDIDGQYTSFIQIREGGVLEIRDSSFFNISNYFQGAVIFAGPQSTVTEIHNSEFRNIVSFYGALFFVQDSSVIKCYNCTISENFAPIAGVIGAYSNGYFEFYDSEIVNNYAMSASIADILDVIFTSVVNNCKVSENLIMTSQEVLDEILDKCQKLCFLSERSKRELLEYTNNAIASKTINSKYAFQIIYGGLKIENETTITNQQHLVNTFVSELAFDNISIENITSVSNMVKVASSNITLSNLEVKNITITEKNDPFISANFDSMVEIGNTTASNSEMVFLQLSGSSLKMNLLKLSELTLTKPVLYFISSFDISISNSIISNISSSADHLVHLTKSQVTKIDNFTVSDSPNKAIDAFSSNITEISKLTIDNTTEGMYLKNAIISSIQDSVFKNLGNEDIFDGAALCIDSSSINVVNSTFSNNTAKNGAAVGINCNIQDSCSNSFTNSSFSNNSASVKGGAIYYNSFRPELNGNTYTSNSAEYGRNIASYPTRIIVRGSSTNDIAIDNVGSGITYSEEAILSLVDYDGQEITTDNTSQIKIVSKTEDATVTGTDYAKAVKGVGTFDDLQFNYKPGASNVEYQATSKAIEASMISAVFGSQFSNNTVSVNFRWCKPGEIQLGTNVCQT